MSAPAGSVTTLLRAWRSGEQGALDALLPLVYAELHRIARRHVAGERARTLSATELVSEAYLRLTRAEQPELDDRVHFFALAARHMRAILVDRARRRGAVKRGAGERPVSFDDAIALGDGDLPAPDLLALDRALSALGALDERKAQAVEMHYFAGMTHEEIARATEVSVRTVQRDLRFAEAWLHERLGAG